MIKNLLYAFIVFYSGLLESCGKNCTEATYNFDMTERFYPEQDSLRTGDTLWVVSSHSSIIKDKASGMEGDFSGSDLGLNIGLLNFTDSTTITSSDPGAFNAFTTFIIIGSEIGGDNLPNQNKGVHFEKRQDSFVLKVAFIPKVKGIYGISLGDAGTTRRNHGCELAIGSVTNTNAENHLYYYQRLFPNNEINSYESTHLYLFKVY